MGKLVVDLQTGYTGQTVVLRVQGREMFRAAVHTDLMEGFARSVELEVPNGRFVLEVEVADTGLRFPVTLDLRGGHYLGISLTDRGLEPILQETPFGYL